MWDWILRHPVEATALLGALSALCGAAWKVLKFHFGAQETIRKHGEQLAALEKQVAEQIEETDPLRVEIATLTAGLQTAMHQIEELKGEVEGDRAELLLALEKTETRITEEITRLRGRYHEVEAVGSKLADFQATLLGRITDLTDKVLAEARKVIAQQDLQNERNKP